MRSTLHDRLLRRELGYSSRYTNIKGMYGDRAWIDDLDIVNDLGGHSGCVNALSWSSSGKLLASGSDDKHLNIYSYQPESSVLQFALTTTVSTGHRANIFSVKFMPHSNDNTLVTCAGDCEVRVFDIEYSSRSTIPSVDSSRASFGRGANYNNLYKGVRYLSYGNTDTRVYKSHTQRVKRIVTESSPNLFLTCSEDGEVRQFDLRLPSTAYPTPKSNTKYHNDPNVPPPLISYKRYNLDLNTISCSASQPHYIALGGAHLHCFLHDRRMLGRDVSEERGNPGSSSPADTLSWHENELMGQATQCVRKFAPNGRKRMRRTDNGHITACKISDANPNEIIVSWSGDHIYSFDLARSPDATESTDGATESHSKGHVKSKRKESADRKGKRKNQNLSTSPDAATRSSKSRQTSNSSTDDGDISIRIRYENGQSEDITMEDHASSVPRVNIEEARESGLNESQKRSLQIAKSVVKVRRLMFSLDVQSRDSIGSSSLNFTSQLNSTLGYAASCLSEIDEIIESWGYPMNPDRGQVLLQQTLRSNREESRRFVQVAGTLARILGGKLQTASRDSSHLLSLFRQIAPTPQDGPHTSQTRRFSYEFLKAITLWLNGDAEELQQGFKRPRNQRLNDPRFPVPQDPRPSSIESIEDYIIPYLLRLAQENFIPNVDASRFERDEGRKIFETETAAVIAFSHAVRMPLEDCTAENLNVRQDREAAVRFWGFKVGRGLLMNAAQGINFQFVDLAFGGLGTSQVDEGRVQDDIDPDEMDDVIESISLVKQGTVEQTEESTISNRQESIQKPHSDDEDSRSTGTLFPSATSREPTVEMEDIESDAEVVLMEDIHNEIAHHIGEDYEDEADSNDEEDDEDEGDGDDDDGGIMAQERNFLFQQASDRGKLRESVEKNVPCSSHTREYRGHCNIKTVKDVNFFGLQDEYVVSGSDSGHLFIWDKKTSELVNILKGDSEVVNVIQGHPYEPLLAVSGIDHTIKIFSPDMRAQADARAGINIGSASNDSSGYESHRRHRVPSSSADGAEQHTNSREGLESCKCMHRSYEITSQNDVERRCGMREAFITRGMLARLAARLRARPEGSGNVEDGEVPIIRDEDCEVM